LHSAVEAGREDMVRLLLKAGASPDSRCASQTTPFYKAASNGFVSILRMLQDAGSDVDARTWDDWTPLHAAVEQDHGEVVKLLVQWGADPLTETSGQDSTGRAGLTALSMAQELGRELDILDVLKNAKQGKEIGQIHEKHSRSRKARPLTEHKCEALDCKYTTIHLDHLREHMNVGHNRHGPIALWVSEVTATPNFINRNPWG
jgi:hypothetical protein